MAAICRGDRKLNDVDDDVYATAKKAGELLKIMSQSVQILCRLVTCDSSGLTQASRLALSIRTDAT